MPFVVILVIIIALLVELIKWFIAVAWPAIVAFFFNVVVPIVLFVLTIGLLMLSGLAVRNAAIAIGKVDKNRRNKPGPEFRGESRLAYIHGPIWEDLTAFAKENWDIASKTPEAPIAFTLRALSVVTTLAVGLAMCAALGLTWVWLGVLLVIDIACIAAKGLFIRCPNCHEQAFFLRYYCGDCGREHRHLRVNRAGALSHECICGTKIPSHFLTGRGGGQPAHCSHPDCNEVISDDLQASSAAYLAIAGGVGSGKTTALVTISNWLHAELPRSGADVRLEDETQRTQMKRWSRDLASGQMPPKTGALRQRAFTFLICRPDKKIRSLFVFDTAGEMFSDSQLQQKHHYFGTTSVVLFIVDPFSLEPVRRSMESTSHWQSILESSPSVSNPFDVASKFINLMKTNRSRGGTDASKTPVHVWVTKTDLGDLDSQIGTTEADLYDWLEKSGADGLLRILENNFTTVRYFSTSAVAVPDPNRRSHHDRVMMELLHALMPSEHERLRSVRCT